MLSSESIGDLALSDSKIGVLTFYPPSKSDLFGPSEPAGLLADVYASDGLFDRLVSALQSGKRATWLELAIEKQGVLEFGWEPDGSRKVWKLESTTKESCVDVESMEVGIAFD